MQVGLGPRTHCVRWRTSSPSPKGHNPQFLAHICCGQMAVCVRWGPSPQFSAHFYCGQTAGCINMPLGMEIGNSPGDCVRWGPGPPSQKWQSPLPQFSAHVCCGQKAGWIKMALGMEVGLGPGHIVLDEDPAPPHKGSRAPQFLAPFVVAKQLDASRCHLVWR